MKASAPEHMHWKQIGDSQTYICVRSVAVGYAITFISGRWRVFDRDGKLVLSHNDPTGAVQSATSYALRQRRGRT
jgi:hypothetical protein